MQKKIIIVDDDEGLLDAFKAMLEFANYKVEASTNADILLNLKAGNLPDLILLDVLLSGVDGRAICKKLKSQLVTKNVPIIMVSAHPSAFNSIKEIGANDYLAKPFEMNNLLNKIDKQIKLQSI
jgi:DNA-binding response OmpR family regulator